MSAVPQHRLVRLAALCSQLPHRCVHDDCVDDLPGKIMAWHAAHCCAGWLSPVQMLFSLCVCVWKLYLSGPKLCAVPWQGLTLRREGYR